MIRDAVLQVTRWLMKHGQNVLDLDMCMGDGTAMWTRFTSGSVGLLALMPNLERLDLMSGGNFLIPSHDMYAMQYLTSLRDLILDIPCCGKWEASLLQPLSGLKKLNLLELTVSGMTSPLLVHSTLSSLTGLTGLRLAREEHPEDYDSDLIDTANIISVISHLTGLKWLHLEGVMDALPGPIFTLQHLSQLWCSSCSLWHGLSSLPEPQEWGCVCEISLTHIPAMDGGLWHSLCQMLTMLPRPPDLNFFNIELAHVCTRDWPFNQRLQRLSFIDCNLSSLPSSLEHLKHLRKLVLVNARAISLKELGRLLGQLQELDLTEQHALHAPAELQEAKSLTKLNLRHDPQADLPSWQSCACILKPWLPATCVLRELLELPQ